MRRVVAALRGGVGCALALRSGIISVRSVSSLSRSLALPSPLAAHAHARRSPPFTLRVDRHASSASAAAASSVLAPFEALFNAMHSVAPWWLAIPVSAFTLRALLGVPGTLLQLSQRRALRALQPHLSGVQLAVQLECGPQRDDEATFTYKRRVGKVYRRMLRALYKEQGISPALMYVIPAVQIPVFIASFFALRRMAGCYDAPAVADFATGGALWFQDLSLVDDTWLLPLLSSSLYLVNHYIASGDRARIGRAESASGASGADTSNSSGAATGAAVAAEPSAGRVPLRTAVINALSFMGSLAAFPLGCYNPAAVLLYWCGSSAFSVAQSLFMRSSAAAGVSAPASSVANMLLRMRSRQQLLDSSTRPLGQAAPTLVAEKGPVSLEQLSSLPLQVVLYFNVYYSVAYFCLSILVAEAKARISGQAPFQLAVLAVWLVLEIVRLLFGYNGNLREKVPQLAGFVLLTVFPQLPLCVYFAGFQSPPWGADIALNAVMIAFQVGSFVLGIAAVRRMVGYQTTRFYYEHWGGVPAGSAQQSQDQLPSQLRASRR